MITRRRFLGLTGAAGLFGLLPGGIGAAFPARAASGQLRVGFINPGRSDEDFWVSVGRLMGHAASRLGVSLTMAVAERSRRQYLQQASDLLRQKPDYLIAVNEEGVGPAVAELAEASGVPLFMLLNAMPFTGGDPRVGQPRYLGALLADNEQAGFSLASHLIAAARHRRPSRRFLRVLALDGVLATPAASARAQGLERALSQTPDVMLIDRLEGEWRQDIAEQRLEAALRRNADIDVIWCANDPMALGAVAAATRRGLHPGEGVVIGGFNGSVAAQTAIAAGQMELSMTGHLFAGALALVMLRDHADGVDFAGAGGVVQSVVFGALDRRTLPDWQARLDPANAARLDFGKLRLADQPDRRGKPYPFVVSGATLSAIPLLP